jgi:hydrogenase maturation protease
MATFIANNALGAQARGPDTALPHARVLCLGNELFGDDSFGYLVAAQLRESLPPGVEIVFTSETGLHLLDHVVGVRSLIVVDTIETGQARPGTIFEFRPGELATFPGNSPHAIGMFDVLDLAIQLSLPVPEYMLVLAVESNECFTLGESISPQVRASIPNVLNMIRKEIVSRT